jgi:hypothetical protein
MSIESSIIDVINHQNGFDVDMIVQIVDEDDQVYYMEGYKNGIYMRWTEDK